jgi:hypothetical protein
MTKFSLAALLAFSGSSLLATPNLPEIELPPIIMEAAPSFDLAIETDVRLDIIEIFEI